MWLVLRLSCAHLKDLLLAGGSREGGALTCQFWSFHHHAAAAYQENT